MFTDLTNSHSVARKSRSGSLTSTPSFRKRSNHRRRKGSPSTASISLAKLQTSRKRRRSKTKMPLLCMGCSREPTRVAPIHCALAVWGLAADSVVKSRRRTGPVFGTISSPSSGAHQAMLSQSWRKRVSWVIRKEDRRHGRWRDWPEVKISLGLEEDNQTPSIPEIYERTRQSENPDKRGSSQMKVDQQLAVTDLGNVCGRRGTRFGFQTSDPQRPSVSPPIVLMAVFNNGLTGDSAGLDFTPQPS
ncbi:hypothetical protein K438DRAFT_1754435 [Mycena galopus ATCC 62051]|nr:hypothetical protein K438DRAFT_1754435 [Mycena galopus ATCC 62051]